MHGGLSMHNNKKKRPVPAIDPESYVPKKINESFSKYYKSPNSNNTFSIEFKTPVFPRSIQLKRRRSRSFSNLSKSELDLSLYDSSKSEAYLNQSFTILKVVGAGVFSEVYKTRSKCDNKFYAVKISRKTRKHNIVSTYNEVKILKSIRPHQNIVNFYYAWEELDDIFIQSELCFIDFRDVLQLGKIEEEELIIFLLHVSNGLSHLHSSGILHMDIKCSNILLGYDGVYKISDFGLSAIVNEVVDTDDITEGDSRYMALELLDNNVSSAVDVFSLGLCMFESIYYIELPSHGDLWQEIRNGVFFENQKPVVATSDKLFSCIKNMLSLKPVDRPTADKLVEMWNEKNKMNSVSTYFDYVKLNNPDRIPTNSSTPLNFFNKKFSYLPSNTTTNSSNSEDNNPLLE